MSDIIVTFCIFITIICWYSFLYIKESIVVDPLSRFSPPNDFNEFFLPEQCDYSSRKSPIIVKISYVITILLAGLGASCLYRIKEYLAVLEAKQGMFGWLLNEFRALQDEINSHNQQSEQFSSEKLLRVNLFHPLVKQGQGYVADCDHVYGAGDNLQTITGIVSQQRPLSDRLRQITIQPTAGTEIIHGIKVATIQMMKIGLKMAALGYYRCRTGVAAAVDSKNLKSTAQNLLVQIRVGSNKSRQGWSRFVKSVKLMVKSFVILLMIEFSGDEGGSETRYDNSNDNNNHDSVNTLSPLIMNNKNRGDTGGGLEENGRKFHIKPLGSDGMSAQEKRDQVMTNVVAAGDGAELGNYFANRVAAKSLVTRSSSMMEKTKMTVTTVPSTLTNAAPITSVQLLDTRQILNMKRQLPLNHRCSCRSHRCWLCSGCRSTSCSDGSNDDIAMIGEREKCYQVKLSYVDKRIFCVNTPTLQQMKSLKLY